MLEKYTRPNGAELLVTDGEEVAAGHAARASGTRTSCRSRREGRQGPLRGHRGGRDRSARSATGDRASSGSRSWSTRATCTRRSSIEDDRGQDPRLPLHPRAGQPRGDGRAEGLGRHAAGQDAARGVAGTQDITGGLPRVTEIFEARRPRNPAVMAEVAGTRPHRRQEARQADHQGQPRTTRTASRSARSRSTTCRRASSSGSTPATTSRPATRWSHGPLVPHDILRITRRRGGAGVPGPRGADGLPQPARGHRRQAHRDHRRRRCSAR